MDDNEETEREELLMRFKLLRIKYKDVHIDHVDDEASLETLRILYTQYVWEVKKSLRPQKKRSRIMIEAIFLVKTLPSEIRDCQLKDFHIKMAEDCQKNLDEAISIYSEKIDEFFDFLRMEHSHLSEETANMIEDYCSKRDKLYQAYVDRNGDVWDLEDNLTLTIHKMLGEVSGLPLSDNSNYMEWVENILKHCEGTGEGSGSATKASRN